MQVVGPAALVQRRDPALLAPVLATADGEPHHSVGAGLAVRLERVGMPRLTLVPAEGGTGVRGRADVLHLPLTVRGGLRGGGVRAGLARTDERDGLVQGSPPPTNKVDAKTALQYYTRLQNKSQ